MACTGCQFFLFILDIIVPFGYFKSTSHFGGHLFVRLLYSYSFYCSLPVRCYFGYILKMPSILFLFSFVHFSRGLFDFF